jgi:hypothetical protein
MRRFWNWASLGVALAVLANLIAPAAAAGRLDELSTREDVLKWIDGYRKRPDPASLPIAMKVLSRRGVLQDPDAAGVYVGFLAGVIGSHPGEADGIVGRVLPALAEEDQMDHGAGDRLFGAARMEGRADPVRRPHAEPRGDDQQIYRRHAGAA